MNEEAAQSNRKERAEVWPGVIEQGWTKEIRKQFGQMTDGTCRQVGLDGLGALLWRLMLRPCPREVPPGPGGGHRHGVGMVTLSHTPAYTPLVPPPLR